MIALVGNPIGMIENLRCLVNFDNDPAMPDLDGLNIVHGIHDTPAESAGNLCVHYRVECLGSPMIVYRNRACSYREYESANGEMKTGRWFSYNTGFIGDNYDSPIIRSRNNWDPATYNYAWTVGNGVAYQQNSYDSRTDQYTQITWTAYWQYDARKGFRCIIDRNDATPSDNPFPPPTGDKLPATSSVEYEWSWNWSSRFVWDFYSQYFEYRMPDLMPAKFQRLIEETLEKWGDNLFAYDDYEQTCSAAVSNTRVNHANMLTLPLELYNTISGKTAVDLADRLVEKVAEGYRVAPSLISSAYLNGRFGSKLTGIELAQFMENSLGSKQWRQKLRARTYGSSTHTETILGLPFELQFGVSFDYAFNGLNYFVKRWDNASLPTLSDVWDAIPFSFVVDWATGLGGTIDALEHNLYQYSMDISNIWRTLKAKCKFTNYSEQGALTASLYFFCRSDATAVIGASYGFGPSGTGKNIADLTAMFIQTKVR